MTNVTAKDFTPSGLKIEGAYENDRNAASAQLLKDILREAFTIHDVIIGHHLTYVKEDKRGDGYTYQIVQEIPSMDALIFDHEIASKIFGENFKTVLIQLAVEPIATRDAKLSELYYSRPNCPQSQK